MIKECNVLCAAIVIAGLGTGAAHTATVNSISAFHRSGQTFITWQEVPDATYNVYRSDKPITMENLSSSERIVRKIPAGSGIDAVGGRMANELIIIAVRDPLSSDWWYEDAVPQNNKVIPQGQVLNTCGKPLPDGTGLCVHTSDRNGSFYYAVTATDASGKEDRTIVTGENALAQPVNESVATPEPIFERTIASKDGQNVRLYVQWGTRKTAYRDGLPQKFKVQVGSGVSKSKPSPLVMLLHGGGGPETLPVPYEDDNVITIAPDDFAPGYPPVYDFWYGSSYSVSPIGDLTQGINVNYAEHRLLHLIEWMQSEYNIDPNRIYLTGGSMGGTGSVIFGLRHPEVFAAIFANVPDVNTGMGRAPHEGWFESIWGKRADAVKTNEGINVWDRLNMTKYVSEYTGDLPFVKVLNSRDDPAIQWIQVPPFFKALNESRHAFIAGWGIGGHNMHLETRPMAIRRFDYMKLAKNISFPAFSNSSMNDDPGDGDPKVGTPTGQMNGGLDWTILSDTQKEWKADIWVTLEGKSDASVDITPRRLQQFKLKAGKKYSFTNIDSTGKVIQSGEVTVDKLNLITLPAIKVSTAGNRISIQKH